MSIGAVTACGSFDHTRKGRRPPTESRESTEDLSIGAAPKRAEGGRPKPPASLHPQAPAHDDAATRRIYRRPGGPARTRVVR